MIQLRSRFFITMALCLGPWGLLGSEVSAQSPIPTTPPTQGDGAEEPEAQPAAPTIDPRFASPRALRNTFFEAATNLLSPDTTAETKANAEDTLIKIFGLEVSQVEFARDSAGRLLAIINRVSPAEASQESLPDAQQVSEQGLTRFVYFPVASPDNFEQWLIQSTVQERYPKAELSAIRRDDGTWRISPETVADLDEFADAVRDLDIVRDDPFDPTKLSSSLWIEERMPRELLQRYFGIKLWKLLGLLAIIFIGVVLDFILRSMLKIGVRRAVRNRGREIDRRTLHRAVRPFGWLVASLTVVAGIRVLGLPEPALSILITAARLFLTFSAVLAAYRLTDLVTEFFVRQAGRTHTRIDDLLVPLIRKTIKIFIAALGVIYLANALNIEILPLLTGLGIGGIAVAFAAKDTIENFFGSVAVILDRPFDVGDWVVTGDVEGTVEAMGLRSTRIRTFYNSVVTVPNASLVRANVDNYGRRKYRRFRTHISITYDTPPDTIEAFCEGIRELIRQHPYTRKDYYNVWLHEMGSASLNILLYVFHEAPDWTTELRERQRLLLDIMRLADAMGVSFAFPTQTLYLREEKDWTHLEPPAGLEQETKARRAGRITAQSVVRGRDWRAEVPGAYEFTGADDIDEEPPSDEGEDGSAVEDRTAGA